MKFSELDKKMRVYEESIDQYIVPGMYIVARLDGRSFTRLTREICKFEAPFDIKFRDLMVATTKHIMDCGFNVRYGYTESDEISLLFSPDNSAFSNKVRKINSILAGEASGFFSLELGKPVCFDSRVVPLPNIDLVKDYFTSIGLQVLEMTPRHHDREAAYSQGVTHFVGRTLHELGMCPTPIATQGYRSLMTIVEQTCNDPITLFYDLQRFNPYAKEMRLSLQVAIEKVLNTLAEQEEELR